MATLKITSKVMSIGSSMIQISNIAEAGLWIDKSGHRSGRKAIGFGVFGLAGAVLYWQTAHPEDAAPIMAVAALATCLVVYGLYLHRAKYTLTLQTTAGRITPLSSTDRGLLEAILEQLHLAMSHENPSQNYVVNIGDRIVNSMVGNSIGGNATISSR